MAFTPVLKRFDIVVFRNKSTPPDPDYNVQVPASAQVDFYAQGATVNEPANVQINAGTQVPVAVWHAGSLNNPLKDPMIPHRVQLGTDSGTTLEVVPPPAGVPPPSGTVTLKNTNPTGQIVVPKDGRLVRITDRPGVFDDPTGLNSTGQSSRATDSTNGRAQCYIAAFRFDYIVSGAGLDTRLFIDADGSFVFRS